MTRERVYLRSTRRLAHRDRRVVAVLKVNDPRPTWFTWVLRALFVAGWVWVGPHLLLGWWS